MSKVKKTAILEKQKASAATAASNKLTPMGDTVKMAKTVHAAKGKKQSRGK